MILVRYFADLLWRSELLEKLESEVEDLDEAEDGESSEEAHRATNQTDQLGSKCKWISSLSVVDLVPQINRFQNLVTWFIGIFPSLSLSISSKRAVLIKILTTCSLVSIVVAGESNFIQPTALKIW